MISILTLIYQVVDNVVMILQYAIILRAILSWLPQLSNTPIVRILCDITDPLLRPFQRFQISGGGFGMDLSPLLAYFALYLIRSVALPMIFGAVLRVGL